VEDGPKICVWNCNGLTENKLNDSEFINKIVTNDIIILTESWTDENSKLDIVNFTCYNYFRKFRHKKAKRNCGGIVVYIRNSIKSGVKIIKKPL
jgi:hypothetical protein